MLFVCTHNSARSQMAEGLLRDRAAARFDVSSAGTEPTRLHPMAARVLDEIGISAAGLSAKSVDPFLAQSFDFVITVCDRARESCPVFPAPTTRRHWSFRDPASVEGCEEERLSAFRRVRDEIAERVSAFVAAQAAVRSTPS